MRKLYGVCLIFMVSAFSLFYYTSYQLSAGRTEKEEESSVLLESEEMVPADNISEIVVTRNMSLIKEVYDLDTGEKVEEQVDIPVEYLGLNRRALVDFLKAQSEDGKSYELMSFSKEAIRVRETLKEIPVLYQYYLLNENGYLLILDLEEEDSFQPTYISIDEFPLSEQDELMDGKGFESMLELYHYLESHTS